jgi:flagellar protein FlbD
MIRVTDLDERVLILNSDLIQHIQETPDTVIVLITGESFRVVETAEEVRQRVIEFQREVGGFTPAALAGLVKQGYGKGTERNG